MKAEFILLFTILFYSVSIYPQWTNQNPVPDGNHLWSTFFIDDNTGWIVGSEGFIKKTTNGGLDWVQQNSGTVLTLRSVQFINQNTGWICGEAGLIIKTTDGGLNWFELSSGTAVELTNLQFLDIHIGYVVGFSGTLLKTTDGGLSWSTQISGTINNLFSVDFVNTLLGYAVGEGRIFLKTTDGGLNWISEILVLNGSPSILNCVEFIDSNVGWVGYGVDKSYANISKTTDGGETWSNSLSEQISIKDTTSHIIPEDIALIDTRYGIHSIYFKDSSNGYAVGGTGDGWNRCIYSTTDAGITWQGGYSYSEQTGLLSVFVNSDGKGWAVGFYGVIYNTEDNGSSWAQILSGSPLPNGYTGDWIYSVFMINDTLGWAGGSRKGIQKYYLIMKTTNGGKIWKTNFEYDHWHTGFTYIFFKDDNLGWAVNGIDGGSYKTTNGGQNWIDDSIIFNNIFFINQDIGWGTTGPGPTGIVKSTDGGNTWLQKRTISCSSVYFSDVNNGWAVGDGGSILKSTDGGETWITKTSGTTSDLSSVRFYDINIGICVGSTGIELFSTDGGETWSSKSGPSLYDFSFINPTTIWGATAGGEVYKTSNFGDTWTALNTGIGGVTSFFSSENNGWVGWNNNIYKYSVESIPVPPPVWTNQIIVEDAGGTDAFAALTFGQHVDATDSIDLILGEYELPPPPITGIFDARFNLPTNTVVSSLIDCRDSVDAEIIWTMTFQPGPAGYPMTFSWDSTSFPEGTFYLKDVINESYVFVNMKNQTSYTLTDPAVTSLNMIFRGMCPIVEVNNEWNMISVPLLAEDMSLSNLFLTATSSAYGYDGGYVTEDTLIAGAGYWLKFGGSEEIQICGSTLGDTLGVEMGWNMFGVYEENILVSQITTTPPGIIATYFFGFENGYYITDTLKSGKGFWVRVSENGILNLNSGELSNDIVQEQIAKIDHSWGKIQITDSEGKSITLFATEEEIQSSLYELPPVPPSGIFDVRYSSGKIVENLSNRQVIRISSDNYPITIKAEGLNITMSDIINGKLLNEELKNGEEIRITDNKITSILLSGRITEGLPIAYELSQNYPNPFNPSTTIKFAVPKESRVNLSIYNILGELVSIVLNEQMKAGYYDYELNASNLASGVYLYRIKAGDYVETKKMVLLR